MGKLLERLRDPEASGVYRASRADEKPAVSGLIPVLLIHNIRRLPPVASFRGARRIEDAPPDRRTHAYAERGGEPGIHIPEADGTNILAACA